MPGISHVHSMPVRRLSAPDCASPAPCCIGRCPITLMAARAPHAPAPCWEHEHEPRRLGKMIASSLPAHWPAALVHPACEPTGSPRRDCRSPIAQSASPDLSLSPKANGDKPPFHPAPVFPMFFSWLCGLRDSFHPPWILGAQKSLSLARGCGFLPYWGLRLSDWPHIGFASRF